MERIIRAIGALDAQLKEKGYDNAFLTNDGFADKLQKSIGRYLHDSLQGKEAGLLNGFSLTSYLDWGGENKDSVLVCMKAGYKNEKLDINEIDIQRIDPNGMLVRRVELKNLTVNALPERKAAIALVKEPATRQINKVKRK